MIIVKVKESKNEILRSITETQRYRSLNHSELLKNFTINEFSLSELNLPSADIILESILKIEKEIGLLGWASNGVRSPVYKGFSLTYNPDFDDKESSIFHQTWGSVNLKQSFSRKMGLGNHTETKNTYYDTYAFRKIHPIIEDSLGFLFKKFSFPILRSRVAYYYGHREMPNSTGTFHVDEFPYDLLRVNIPLQTSEEYILDIVGEDEHGNKLNIVNKHLEVGKIYLWNTRIPHRLGLLRSCKNTMPRIHMVFGFSPWFRYDNDEDMFIENQCFGTSIKNIVDSRLFLS